MVDVTRSRFVDPVRLGANEWAALRELLVDIVQHWFEKSDREFIATHVVNPSHSTLSVLYHGGTPVGFASVRQDRVEHQGQSWTAFDIGTYVRPGVRGAPPYAVRLGIRCAVRAIARRPWGRFALVAECAVPGTYARLAQQMSVVYPRPGVAPPPAVSTLVSQVMARRGMLAVDGDPWVVTLPEPAALRNPERIDGSARLRADPDAVWYIERNPGFKRGHWLVLFAPLRPHHVAAMALPPLRRVLSNRDV